MQGEILISLTDGKSPDRRGKARPYQGTPAAAGESTSRPWMSWEKEKRERGSHGRALR